MAENNVHVSWETDNVEVTTVENGDVSVELGDAVTVVGSRYDVHRLIIEADRKLSRLANRWA